MITWLTLTPMVTAMDMAMEMATQMAMDIMNKNEKK